MVASATVPAWAAPTFTVTAGSAPSGTQFRIMGTTQGASPQVVFNDATSGQTLTCASATATGNSKTGTGLSGSHIAAINSSTWTGCTGPAGLAFTVTQSQNWFLNAVSGNASSVSGNIINVKATVSDPGVCTFVVTGKVAAVYNNTSPRTLTIPGTQNTLTVSGVSGCFGVINNGDVANFKAVYKIRATNSAYNPVTVKSP